VEDSYSSSNVSTSGNYAGGLIGYTFAETNTMTTQVTDSYFTGTLSAASGVGSIVGDTMPGHNYVTITNTGSVCDPAVGVEEVCSSAQAQSVNTTWSGTSWSGNGSSVSPTLESGILPSATWDGAVWNLGSGNPTLKNMPN
jgi:hypothetical protein